MSFTLIVVIVFIALVVGYRYGRMDSWRRNIQILYLKEYSKALKAQAARQTDPEAKKKLEGEIKATEEAICSLLSV